MILQRRCSLPLNFLRFEENKTIPNSSSCIMSAGALKKHTQRQNSFPGTLKPTKIFPDLTPTEMKEALSSDSSSESSGSSLSLSDTLLKVRRLTQVYDVQQEELLMSKFNCHSREKTSTTVDDNELHQDPERSEEKSVLEPVIECTRVSQPSETSPAILCSKAAVTPAKFGDKSYRLPTKAAAILGADDNVISQSFKPQHALFLDNKPVNYKVKKSGPISDAEISDTLHNRNLKQKRKIGLGLDVREKLASLLKPTGPNEPGAMVPSAVGGHGGGSAGNHSSSSTSSTLPANFCSPSVGAGSTGHSLQLRELEKLIKAGKVTFNQIRGWSMSFECLLHDKFGLALFHDFLRSEFSDENIEFWIACEEYRTIANMRKLQMRAEKIYNDFVGVQAAREVNLDSRTRQQTELDIQQPSQTTFDTAQKRIQALMEKDSYQRFLRSELYCRLLRLVSQQHAPAPPAAPVAPHSQSRGPTIGSLGLTAHDLSRLTMTTSKLALVPVPPPARPKPAPTTSPTNPSCTVNTVQPDEPCLPFYQTSLIYSPAKK